jgi:hypothetical protein
MIDRRTELNRIIALDPPSKAGLVPHLGDRMSAELVASGKGYSTLVVPAGAPRGLGCAPETSSL